MTKRSRKAIALLGAICLSLLGAFPVAEARNNSEVALSAQGETLLAKYRGMLESLSSEVTASLPAIDEQKQTAFLEARAALAGIKVPGENATSAAREVYDKAKAEAEANALLSLPTRRRRTCVSSATAASSPNSGFGN